MPRALAAAWVAAMGMYMLVRRDQVARELAGYAAAGVRRNKEQTYRRQHRVLVIVVPAGWGLFSRGGCLRRSNVVVTPGRRTRLPGQRAPEGLSDRSACRRRLVRAQRLPAIAARLLALAERADHQFSACRKSCPRSQVPALRRLLRPACQSSAGTAGGRPAG